MGKSKVLLTDHDLEGYLSKIVQDQALFSAGIDYTVWKNAFMSLYMINQITTKRIILWKYADNADTFGLKILKSIRILSGKFKKLIRKKGTSGGIWKGAKNESAVIWGHFLAELIPLFVELAQRLNSGNRIRVEIEELLFGFTSLHVHRL